MNKEISKFLNKFKDIVKNRRGLYLIPRSKNNETINKLEINLKIVKEIILSLEVHNYCKGPEYDDKFPNDEIWVFGTHVDEIEIYIKLKIAYVNNVEIAKCLSFHESEWQLYYPMRSSRK